VTLNIQGLKPCLKPDSPSLDETISPLHAVGEINAKCFYIFGMVQHIFTRIDLHSQDAAPTLFNEML
jgi:hypothetical protein